MQPSQKQILAENKQLRDQLHRTQQDLELLVNSGRWLVWSCTVTAPAEGSGEWLWEFRSDYGQAALEWLDIEITEGEDFGAALTRARLPEDNSRCDVNFFRELYAEDLGYTQEYRVCLKNGTLRWLEENVIIVPVAGHVWRMVGICIDATERKSNEAQLALANLRLEALATTDGLTGIKNHRAFQEQLHVEWHKCGRYHTPLSLVLIDLDHFKNYNESFGHPAGDDVLKQAAQLLQQCARESDSVARYGGEEFMVILPQADSVGAMALAERFRQTIESADWPRRSITVSLGVATMHALTANSHELIMEADRALCHSKKVGRNWVTHASTLSSNVT
jgi:diguanylate cyclase (GGDEF)-like protein